MGIPSEEPVWTKVQKWGMAGWCEEWCEIQCGWRVEVTGMGEEHTESGQGQNVEVLQNQAECEYILWQQWEMVRSMIGFSNVEIRDEGMGMTPALILWASWSG